MPEELWIQVPNIVQEMVTKTIPRRKKCNKAKSLSEEGLQIAEKRSQGERERYINLNAEFQKKARRDEKALLSEHCKEIVLLPGKLHGQRSLVGYSPCGRRELNIIDCTHSAMQ